MTAAEIKTWVYSHIDMKKQIVFNTEGHYKIKFENGDTYEYSSIEKNISANWLQYGSMGK